MVAPVGIGKAAATVTEKASTPAAGSASKASVAKFQEALGKGPDAASAGGTVAAGQAQAAGNTGATTAPPATQPALAGPTTAPGPGDKILRGIDNVRNEASRLVLGATQSGGAVGDGGKVSDLLDMQASMIDFEVATQVGGKGVQETNQGIQTLLKGQ